MDLNKLSTARLLGRLDKLRSKTLQYWNHYGESDEDTKQFAADLKEVEQMKAILGGREHYPRGKKGRQLRQKEKQNR